jgi:two-component system, chemotaxis family, protein-glutamate methylesterase/glutaminase
MEKQESTERRQVELICPDCQGPIWEERQGRIVEYECRVGHRFSPLTMMSGLREAAENKLWNAVVSLETAADLAERLAAELGEEGVAEAHDHRRRASAIKQMLGNAGGGAPGS